MPKCRTMASAMQFFQDNNVALSAADRTMKHARRYVDQAVIAGASTQTC